MTYSSISLRGNYSLKEYQLNDCTHTAKESRDVWINGLRHALVLFFQVATFVSRMPPFQSPLVFPRRRRLFFWCSDSTTIYRCPPVMRSIPQDGLHSMRLTSTSPRSGERERREDPAMAPIQTESYFNACRSSGTSGELLLMIGR